jgi:hypothetical protein
VDEAKCQQLLDTELALNASLMVVTELELRRFKNSVGDRFRIFKRFGPSLVLRYSAHKIVVGDESIFLFPLMVLFNACFNFVIEASNTDVAERKGLLKSLDLIVCHSDYSLNH